MTYKCDIRGCLEDVENSCEANGCNNNKICDMHTHVVCGRNNKSIFVCEECHKKGNV
jgi:hypothetical protein